MKKILTLMLSVLVLVMVGACGGNTPSEDKIEATSSKKEAEEKKEEKEEAEPEHTDDEFTIEKISYELVDEADPSMGTNIYIKVRNNSGEAVALLEVYMRALDANGDVLSETNTSIFKLNDGQAGGNSDIAQFYETSYKDIETIEILSYSVSKKSDEEGIDYEWVYDHDYSKPITFKMADIPKKGQ